MSDPMHARFRELLPRFVNGTIDEVDRTFMNEYLESNPAARAELKFEKALQQAVRHAIERRPQDAGLPRLLQEWQAERANARQLSAPGFVERLRRWKDDWGLSPAFAIAATLAVVQAGILVYPDRSANVPTYRSSAAPGEPRLVLLQLTPKPQITYVALAETLRREDVLIVTGPDASGILMVSVPPGVEGEVAGRRLMDSGLFDDVAVVPPPR